MAHHQKTHKKDMSVPAGYTTTAHGVPHTVMSNQHNSLPSLHSLRLNGNIASGSTEMSGWYDSMPSTHHEQTPQQAVNGSFPTSPVSSANVDPDVPHGVYGMVPNVTPPPLTMYGYARNNDQQGQTDDFDDAEIEVTDYRIGTGQPGNKCILEVKREDQLYGPFAGSQNGMTNTMTFGELDYNGTQTQAEGFDNLVIPNEWSGEPPQH